MSDDLIETAQAFETIKKSMQDDKPGDSGSYAHTWHCNIAMACYDAISSKMYDDPAGFDSARAHEIGNQTASRFMKLCFDVETKDDASECGKEKPAARNYDEKREIRKLKPDEMVRLGDVVTVAKDDIKGYRPLQGLVDILAGEYSYPIYRNDDVGAGCDHDFVDAKNEYFHGADVCKKCKVFRDNTKGVNMVSKYTAIENHIKSLKIALERIAKWEELDIKTRVDIGSNGVRNYYRKIAIEALESQRGEFFEGGGVRRVSEKILIRDKSEITLRTPITFPKGMGLESAIVDLVGLYLVVAGDSGRDVLIKLIEKGGEG